MSHSIAAYTGTIIDSSAKHIVACRMCNRLFGSLGLSEQELVQNKYRYAMQKDEVALNVNRFTNNLDPTKDEFEEHPTKHAYPSIVTTLGDKVTENLKNAICEHYREMDPWEPCKNIVYEDEGGNRKVFPFQFDFQGVSVGTAYASDLTGDTVASVMIGGMATVLNGHFPCYTGELVQWYFDFENREFDDEGYRFNGVMQRNRNINHEPGRELYYRQRMYAEYKETTSGKRNMAFIKPYRPVRDTEDGYRLRDYKYGDKVRVFGKIVNGGQPWEMIDVFIFNVIS